MTGRVSDIVSDEDVIRVHRSSNFGAMTPREVVNDGVRKYAVGFTGGWTQLNILLEHGLIRKPRPGRYDADLTKKGKAYARALWHLDKASKATVSATLAGAGIADQEWITGVSVQEDSDNNAVVMVQFEDGSWRNVFIGKSRLYAREEREA